MRTKKFHGHKVRPACTAESSAVLTCAERQIKGGSPTFQFPLNLHDLLRESFIVPFMVPSSAHSTIIFLTSVSL